MKDQMGLFQKNETANSPLAFELRPSSLDEFFGQSGAKKRIARLNFEKLPHIIFWGPPGTGKTTLAEIMAKRAQLELFNFNAVMGGVNDLRKLIAQAQDLYKLEGKKSIIFIDEIHRFNKAQQDALLPYLEKGDFVLFGATTEYPQTALNRALLSRVQLWNLEKLSKNELKEIIKRALNLRSISLVPEVVDFIADNNNGDARAALNQVEILEQNKDAIADLDFESIKKQFLFSQRQYDKNSERHYDVISAFIKSLRGSDANAALLWLAVMLDGGEDPVFIARRLIIAASEDIGNADPRALQLANDAHYATKQIGMPEARIPLAQAAVYLANAPKSNSSYLAIDEALSFVRENKTIEVPTHLRNNHPDKKNYKYPHSYPNHWTEQNYSHVKERFYTPGELGYERMQTDNLDKMKKA
ncbi:MAG: replication-associated recombination protein A [Bacteriovoracaceae bacterium]